MRIALVYDRVNKWGGAERVLLVLHEMFPRAPLYTSVYTPHRTPWADVFPRVHTSFLQKLPLARRKHESLAPLMPSAFESFNFDKYDLVISVTSEAAKGIITKPHTKHICYMLTPTRYLWSGYDEYFKDQVFKGVTKPITYYLRKWDKMAASRPDKILSISKEVQKRVKKYYKRNSIVINPPNMLKSAESKKDKEEGRYYLAVGRLVPYKKFDLLVKTFNETGQKLVIVGDGSEMNKLKAMAKKNIKFTGSVNDDDLVDYYKNAKALVFPQIEDFGLVAVEAQSFGVPVIAYKSGGVLDIVQEGLTGVFITRQTIDGVKEGLKEFERTKFDDRRIIGESKKFSKSRFKKEFLSAIENV